MDNNGKFLYSWPVILLVLCIFWPVGIFLIIKKVSIDRKIAMVSGKLIGWLGIASYCIAALDLLVCISDGFDGTDVVMILFFGGAGFALRKVAKKIKTEAENVKQYLSIIVNGNVRELDNIASSTGKSYDVVHKEVKKMIDKGYLKNAYIDEGMREVVLPNSTPTQENNVNVVTASATTQSPGTVKKIVACKCCGANNIIYDTVGECEYCGSPLK